MNLDPNFKEFLSLLNATGVRYLLIGGYAVALHGFPRYTNDLDIWIAIAPANAQKIAQVVQTFFGLSKLPNVEQFLDPELLLRTGMPPLKLEIMTSISGVVFDECYARKVDMQWSGITIPVISLQDLRANKLASGRDKDLLDLKNLPDS